MTNENDTPPPFQTYLLPGEETPPCLEASILREFLRLPEGFTEEGFNRILQAKQNLATEEAIANSQGLDCALAEQAVLLDAAFRYYLSSDPRYVYDTQFLLGLKAQDQATKTLRSLRTIRRNALNDQRDFERAQTKAYAKLQKEKEHKNQKDEVRTSRYFDRLSE